MSQTDSTNHDRGNGPADQHGDFTDPAPFSGDDAGSALEARVQQLEAEVEDAKNRALRTMADYQNYQRRALQNELVAKADGVSKVVASVVPVLDTFDVALQQDISKASAEQVMAGLRAVRDELLKALSQHGVGVIIPGPNDEFTPGRHEAIMQQPAEGVAPGHVVQCFQAGYSLANQNGERILRPAKVVVAPTA